MCSFGIGISTVWPGVELSEKLKEGHWTLLYYIMGYKSYEDGKHRIIYEILEY